MDGLSKFFEYTGFANFTIGHLVMITVGLILFRHSRGYMPRIGNTMREVLLPV